MKILAVDDDLFILELLPMIAARAGFRDVSTASSGGAALKKLNTEDAAFDCLLFDISMPDMDGIDLCTRVRAIPAYAKTPIIMVTAMADKVYVDRAFAAGATDYVNKPFDVVELGARLGMAEELIATRRVAKAGLLRDEENAKGTAVAVSAPLANEVQIDGVASLIEYVALKNYLSQLSGSSVAGAQVIAFRISQIEKIHESATKDQFLRVLTEAASAIIKAAISFRPMMAYIGNGMFLMVLEKPILENSNELESAIQSTLDSAVACDNNGPLKVVVLASNPIRPSTSKLQRVRKTFDRAILRAEKLEVRR